MRGVRFRLVVTMLLSTTVACQKLHAADVQQLDLISPYAGFPESPLVRTHGLLYTELSKNSVFHNVNGLTSEFWSSEGCGPTGIVERPTGELLVACNADGRLVRLSPDGAELGVYTGGQGHSFSNPNDLTNDGRGGVYVSDSGPVGAQHPAGRLFHLNAAGDINLLADGLAYANGISLSPDGNTLFVSELYRGSIAAWDVDDHGNISRKRTFVELRKAYDDLGLGGAEFFHPDGMAFDKQGRLYVAMWSDRRILIFGSNGDAIGTIDIDVGSGVTNLDFGPDGDVYVTVVFDKRPPFPGGLYHLRLPAELDNPSTK